MLTNVTSGFTLSPAQQRVWRLGVGDGLATYRIEIDFDTAPGIEEKDLCDAMTRVAGRHEILRTDFGLLPGMELPVQSPLASAHPVTPADGQEASADPNRMILQRLAGNRYRLILSALCADAQTGLLVLQQTEAELSASPPPQSDDEPLPFSSLAQWQHDMLADAADVKLPAWPDRPSLNLPFQLREPPTASRAQRHAIALTASLQAKIEQIALDLEASVEHVLLAAWSALLLRLNQQPVPVAYLAHGRGYAEVATLMGPFARFTPLAMASAPEQAFSALVKAAAKSIDETLSVQDYLPPLPPERHPLLGFAWSAALPAPGSQIRPAAPFAWTDHCLLLLCAHRHGDGRIALYFDHDASACDATALGRLEEEYVTVLQSAADDPHQALETLLILGPDERRLTLESFCGRPVPAPTPWHAAYAQVNAALRAAAGKVVIEEPGLQLDGPAFALRIDRIAARLRQAGATRGSIVGLLLPRGIDMVAGMLAIQQAGGAYLPLDTGYPEDRLAFMMQDSGARLLLTSEDIAADLSTQPAFAPLLTQTNVLTIDAPSAPAATNRSTNPAAFPAIDASDLAYLIYTSGTSGRPKGVRVPHGALANHMAWMLRELPLDANDALLQKTAISFDASVWEIFAPLIAGARLVLAPAGAEGDPDELAGAIERYGVTVVQVVPSLLRLLVENQRFQACGTLRRLCCGGEALDAGLARRSLALGVELVNLYGPTETTIQITAERVSAKEKTIAIGKPIDNTRVYILDRNGQPVPVGVRGEIHIGGMSLADGYHRRPELTAERFIADPFTGLPGERMYRSGDVGAWRADGRIDSFGRADRQVKLRGYRIELSEIEAVAAGQPGVALVAALVDRDAAGIDQLLCFYSMHPGRQLDASAFKQALAAKLPEYMTPNWLVQIDSFPTLPNGKIDTAALLQLRPSTTTASRGPRDTLEMRLERIWEDVLNIGHVGINSNFFELGGHSLLAVRLMAEIEKEFCHRLPLTSLFAAPTIAEQAGLLRGESIKMDPIVVPIRSGNAGRSPIVLVHPTGGSVLCYREFASGIRTGRPIIALQDPGLSGQASYESVEELAGSYLDRLEPLVNDRRYLLAGWSSGGVIAYEIARQALARGHEIALLCLIDSRMTRTGADAQAPGRERLIRSISRLIAHKAALHCPDLSGLPFEQALQRLLELAREADFVPADAGKADIEKLFHVFERNVTAIGRYEAGPLPRRTLIMKATEALPESIREAAAHHVADDMLLSWDQLCFANIREIAADHLSIMEKPRLAGVLAVLDNELEEIERLHGLHQQNLMPMLGL